MEIPTVKIRLYYGDCEVTFDWEEYRNPDAFEFMLNGIVKKTVNSVVGQSADTRTLEYIKSQVNAELAFQVFTKGLWKSYNGSKWDCLDLRNADPNNLMKHLI